MQLILSLEKLFFIEWAKWTCVGIRLIVFIAGMIVSESVFGWL